jgi:hypothetical protein
MIRNIALGFVIGVSWGRLAYAQSGNPIPNNVRATNAIDAFTNHVGSPGYLLYGIPMSSGDVEGDYYLHDEWKSASIKLFQNDQVYVDVKCKINLLSEQVEIPYPQGIRGIDINRVESISYNVEYGNIKFINSSSFLSNEIPQIGLLEVLVSGNVPLLKRTTLIIKKPDYNIQLNVGNKNTRLIQEDIVYTVLENELINIKRLNKKKLTSLFRDKEYDVSSFIKKERKNLHRMDDIKSIFQYGNDLLKEKDISEL